MYWNNIQTTIKQNLIRDIPKQNNGDGTSRNGAIDRLIAPIR